MLEFLTFLAILNQFFEADLEVDIRVLATHYRLSGAIKADSFVPGMFAHVYGDDPNNYWSKLNATVVVEPNGGTVTVWEVENGKCSKYGVYEDNALPKLAIPDNAILRGTEVCDKYGASCSIWRVNRPYTSVSYADIWIYETTLMKIEAEYTGASVNAYLTIDFKNTRPVHPQAYWFLKPSEC